jgi:endonuclease G
MPVSDTTPDVSGRLKGGGWFQMQLAKRDRQNGDSRLLVQIGESSDPRNVGVAQGTWTLEIVALTSVSGTPIHAWIARLGGEPSEFQNDVSPKMTITVPGTAQSVIAVGAVEATIPTFPGPFSSSGPTRDGREKPDLVAPGVCVNAAKAGTLQDAREESGTSMAAPHVAGAVALILSRAAEIGRPWPTANQIAVALRQMTKDYNGRHDSSQGYGVLDVAKVLSAF